MSQYVRRTYGPGDIAALPPTIGLTSREPTIGAEDVGRPIKPAFPFKPMHPKAGAPVRQAGLFGMGLDYQVFPTVYCGGAPAGSGNRGAGAGMGTNGSGNGNGNGGWMLPVGVGLAIGIGLAYMLRKREEEAELAF
jgi:hypothetical protein